MMDRSNARIQIESADDIGNGAVKRLPRKRHGIDEIGIQADLFQRVSVRRNYGALPLVVPDLREFAGW